MNGIRKLVMRFYGDPFKGPVRELSVNFEGMQRTEVLAVASYDGPTQRSFVHDEEELTSFEYEIRAFTVDNRVYLIYLRLVTGGGRGPRAYVPRGLPDPRPLPGDRDVVAISSSFHLTETTVEYTTVLVTFDDGIFMSFDDWGGEFGNRLDVDCVSLKPEDGERTSPLIEYPMTFQAAGEFLGALRFLELQAKAEELQSVAPLVDAGRIAEHNLSGGPQARAKKAKKEAEALLSAFLSRYEESGCREQKALRGLAEDFLCELSDLDDDGRRHAIRSNPGLSAVAAADITEYNDPLPSVGEDAINRLAKRIHARLVRNIPDFRDQKAIRRRQHSN